MDYKKQLQQMMDAGRKASSSNDKKPWEEVFKPKQGWTGFVRPVPSAGDGPPMVKRDAIWNVFPGPIENTYGNPAMLFNVGLRNIMYRLGKEHPWSKEHNAFKTGLISKTGGQTDFFGHFIVDGKVEVWQMSYGAYKAFREAVWELEETFAAKSEPLPDILDPEAGIQFKVKFADKKWRITVPLLDPAPITIEGWQDQLKDLEQLGHTQSKSHEEILAQLQEQYNPTVAKWGLELDEVGKVESVDHIIALGQAFLDSRGKDGQSTQQPTSDETKPEVTSLFTAPNGGELPT